MVLPDQGSATDARRHRDTKLAAEYRSRRPKTKCMRTFRQKAADNKKPPRLGIGLTEKADQEQSETDKSDRRIHACSLEMMMGMRLSR